jgi:hypothetical protein
MTHPRARVHKYSGEFGPICGAEIDPQSGMVTLRFGPLLDAIRIDPDCTPAGIARAINEACGPYMETLHPVDEDGFAQYEREFAE